ncbi:MAG: hypothetical protein DME82_03010 [Verrucomicrobia bacterium]|jgi:hypothetical protein|nr:MAG: hypothetical protein DME82_03010 [Verrucomicrobiota bacterium]
MYGAPAIRVSTTASDLVHFSSRSEVQPLPRRQFYAIGLSFARRLENSVLAHKMVVESAAAEFARLQPLNVSGLTY